MPATIKLKWLQSKGEVHISNCASKQNREALYRFLFCISGTDGSQIWHHRIKMSMSSLMLIRKHHFRSLLYLAEMFCLPPLGLNCNSFHFPEQFMWFWGINIHLLQYQLTWWSIIIHKYRAASSYWATEDNKLSFTVNVDSEIQHQLQTKLRRTVPEI